MTPEAALSTPAVGRRFASWLALCAASLAGLVAGMLFLQVRQGQELAEHARLRADSITALTFQFEREFLRLRHGLDTAQHHASPDAADELALRFDILVSRKTLLEDNPSIQLLKPRTEYARLMPLLNDWLAKAELVLQAQPLDTSALHALATDMDALGPDVQALSLASVSVISQLIEQKQSTISGQNSTIVWLTAVQLVLLLVTAVALWVRNNRQMQERAALQALTRDLVQATERAEEANAGKTRFLANMSHELRTPFNGVLGMLSMLEATPLTPQQLDYTRTAHDSAQHLLTLLNDILDLSAMEAGKLSIKPVAVELPRLISDLETLVRGSAQRKGLALQVTLPEQLPTWVQVDPTRFKQILLNLLGNAIKFTEQGYVWLGVSWEARPGQQGELTCEVSDTGIGMDAQALGKLFQRFYQVESGNERRFGGTGLGLEISRNLARMMNGDLSATSQPGKGSIFTLRLVLPVTQAPHNEPVQSGSSPTTPVPAPATVHVDTAPAALAGKRVLVVEDHPVNQKLMAALLQKTGCNVTFCENGQLAVETVAGLQPQTFDLIFMDIHMPVMDGLTATRLIRQSFPDMRSLPIIALTADVMNAAETQALAAGVNEFVPKPIRLPELQAILLRWVNTPNLATEGTGPHTTTGSISS